MSFTAEGGAVFGRSFLTAGAMMSLIALPMVFGGDARGPAVDSAARARGVLRRSARRRSRRSAASCCRRCGRTSPPARRSGWAASPATPRSSWSCSAPRCSSSPRARSPASTCCKGTGGDADELRLQQLARGRGQRAAEGVRGGVRAAADRHRPELRRRPHRPARGPHGPRDLEAGSTMITATNRGPKSDRDDPPQRAQTHRRRSAGSRRHAADRRAAEPIETRATATAPARRAGRPATGRPERMSARTS